MGWKPSEVRAESLRDFNAAYAGFATFHGLDEEGDGPVSPPTRAEVEELFERYG